MSCVMIYHKEVSRSSPQSHFKCIIRIYLGTYHKLWDIFSRRTTSQWTRLSRQSTPRQAPQMIALWTRDSTDHRHQLWQLRFTHRDQRDRHSQTHCILWSCHHHQWSLLQRPAVRVHQAHAHAESQEASTTQLPNLMPPGCGFIKYLI